jgi:hypothetical protein
MKLSAKDAAMFLELETSLHKKQVRNSADAASALLADDFFEFGSSGKVWDKTSIVASMRTETTVERITVEDFAARELAPGVVLVTYVARRGKKAAGDAPTFSTLRSSIWKRVDGKWQMIFHQGTKFSASAL